MDEQPKRRHSAALHIRLFPEHQELVRLAAESAARRKGAGDLSSWIRETLVAAARRELKRGDGDD